MSSLDPGAPLAGGGLIVDLGTPGMESGPSPAPSTPSAPDGGSGSTTDLSIWPSDIRGLKPFVTKRPIFDTLIQASPSALETRIAQRQNPIWHWQLVYDYLYNSADGFFNNALLPGRSYPDLQLLMGFFLKHKGQQASFLYEDPEDHHVGPALVTIPPSSVAVPNPLAQLQLIQDPTTGIWYSPIQRNMGGQFFEDITDLNGVIAIYANGVLQASGVDYNIGGPGLAISGFSSAGLYAVWAAQPAGMVTAEFDFYFRVRFSSDEQDFERFMQFLWTIGGHGRNGKGYIEFQSARFMACAGEGGGGGPVAPPALPVDTCPGVTGTIILPFGDFESHANHSPSVDAVMACQVPFDPADYPGITGIRFKGTFVKWDQDFPDTPDYTEGPSFEIVDENGTVYLPYPSPSFSANPDDTFYLQADIDVVFPYDPANAHIYYIRETNDAAGPTDSNEWQSFGAALYVSVVNSDEAKLDFVMLPLFAFNPANVGLYSRNSTSYGIPTGFVTPPAAYTKTADAQSDIDYREGWFIADPFTGAGFGALFRVGGAMVPGTEITIAAGNGTDFTAYSVQFEDDIVGFEPGQYEWQFKKSATNGIEILGAGLRTKIGNAEGDLCATNFETQAQSFVIDCESNYLQRAWKYVAAEWPSGLKFYFEATWNNGETVNLVDTGTDGAPIDPPTIVSGSSLTFPGGATYTTMRSGEITDQLIDGHWYTVTVNPSTAPVTDLTASIIIVRPAA